MILKFPAAYQSLLHVALPLPEAKRRARLAAARLHWKVRSEHDSELIFRVGLSLWSWGEEVKVGFEADDLVVHSHCRLPTQCFDHGKNRRNCERFAQAYGT